MCRRARRLAAGYVISGVAGSVFRIAACDGRGDRRDAAADFERMLAWLGKVAPGVLDRFVVEVVKVMQATGRGW